MIACGIDTANLRVTFSASQCAELTCKTQHLKTMSLCSKSALNLPLHSLRVYSLNGSMELAKRTNAGNQSRELLARQRGQQNHELPESCRLFTPSPLQRGRSKRGGNHGEFVLKNMPLKSNMIGMLSITVKLRFVGWKKHSVSTICCGGYAAYAALSTLHFQ
jgi:hypothetical protein